MQNSKAALWTGRVLSGLPTLLLLFSSWMKLSQSPEVTEGFAKFGFAPDLVSKIGVVEAICTILYIIPQTCILGAILLTGYLGGAVVTHLRAGDAFFMPIVLGVILWLGLVLREPRLRSLLPWRSLSATASSSGPSA